MVTHQDLTLDDTKIVTYDYDAFDRKVAKHVDDGGDGTINRDEFYVYDGDDVLWDFVDVDGEDPTESLVIAKRYLHGPATDQILAVDDYDSGDVLWYLTDNLGTVRDLAEAVIDGQSGDVTDVVIDEHYSYDSFGNVLSGDTTKTRYLYTGREFDTDTGLQYNRARWYDPATGSWLSEDPIGFTAGDTNLTRYVGNNVTNATDPSGLEGFWDWLWSVPDSKRGSQADKTIAENNLNRASADPHNPFALSEIFAREKMRGVDGAIRDAQGLTHGAIEWNAGGVGNIGRSAAGKGLNKFAQGSQGASKGGKFSDDLGRAGAVGRNKASCPPLSLKGLPNPGSARYKQLQSLRKRLQNLGPGNSSLRGMNSSLASVTSAEAAHLGKSFVGGGHSVTSAGFLLSKDGTRLYRPPSLKPGSPFSHTGKQANFIIRNFDELTGKWYHVSNGHIDILD